MDGKKTPEQFVDEVIQFRSTDTSILIKNKIGDIILFEIQSQVEELKGMLNHVSLQAIRELPEARFRALRTLLQPILAKIKDLYNKEKNKTQAEDQQTRDIIRFFSPLNQGGGEAIYEKNKDTIWNIICESLTLLNYKNFDKSNSEKRLIEISNILMAAEEVKNKIDDILTSAQTDLAKGGVGKHADIFSSQANIHRESANKWREYSIRLLGINAVIIIVILALVIWLNIEQSNKVEAGIFGGALVSLISFGIVLCVKNYFAEKHNQSVNQHKANCLGTYNTFIDSADGERRAAVLLQATQTIFSHQKSGYLSNDSDVSHPNPIIEIVRNLAREGNGK